MPEPQDFHAAALFVDTVEDEIGPEQELLHPPVLLEPEDEVFSPRVNVVGGDAVFALAEADAVRVALEDVEVEDDAVLTQRLHKVANLAYKCAPCCTARNLVSPTCRPRACSATRRKALL